MRFSKEFIEKVREATDIVSLVSEKVELRKTGGRYVGLCPIHTEKTPSFTVNPDRQSYYCFGCKNKGDVFRYVQDTDGLSFPEAVEKLGQRANLEFLERSTTQPSAEQIHRKKLVEMNSVAMHFYREQLKRLPEDHKAKQYLRSRGLSDDIISAFRIGYAPDDWTNLTDQLLHWNESVPNAEELGLMRPRKKADGHYDLFRDRIMFPILSSKGECLGFGGRTIGEIENAPKYMNSPASPVFQKEEVLFGINHTAKYIRHADEAVIVEGYMDFLALYGAGIKNVVAILGTALTESHLALLKKYTKRAILLLDGDDPGRAAAYRCLPLLLREGFLARGMFLSDKLDPDEFLVTKGKRVLAGQLNASPDLFDLICNDRSKNILGRPSEKLRALDEFATILASAEDSRIVQLYARNLANLFEVDLEIVFDSIKRCGKGNPT